MKFTPECLKLYAVTDRSWLNGQTLLSQVEQALKGGTTMVQLREKTLSKEVFLAEACLMRELTRKYNVPLIINDNIEVALLSEADGVHIGQKDCSIQEARKYLGTDKIIGVTAKTPKQARLATEAGATYLGSGAVFGSGTKLDATPLSYETLQEICHSTPLPIVAIGGITEENILKLKGSPIAGVAVVSGLFKQPDIYQSARHLRELIETEILR